MIDRVFKIASSIVMILSTLAFLAVGGLVENMKADVAALQLWTDHLRERSEHHDERLSKQDEILQRMVKAQRKAEGRPETVYSVEQP